jgi:hypothetical protein
MRYEGDAFTAAHPVDVHAGSFAAR